MPASVSRSRGEAARVLAVLLVPVRCQHTPVTAEPPPAARQREVVLLPDIEGMSSEEVCAVLALTEGNQRVLLHRGRSRLRQLFEDEFREVR
jgi:hypothetical protein